MNRVDLHMHTVYSDGRATPEELLRAANAKGLRTVAISDHETAQGSREARPLATELGLELIPAIELTVTWSGYTGHGGGPDIDILGYFIDLESPELYEHERKALAYYSDRAARVCAALRRGGYALDLGDVLAVNATYPGYLAIVRALLTKGVASQSQAATLIDSAWQAEGTPLGMDKAIDLVHRLGGVAVLAHPAIIRRDDLEPLNERGLGQLVEMGLDGLEVLHYRNSPQQRRYFSLLARMFKLPVSGGSDEHGGPDTFPRLGSEPVTSEMVAALRRVQPRGAAV